MEHPVIRIERNVEMTTRDGVILRGNVWRPDDDKAYPAIVERTPYGKERAIETNFLRADRIAEHGYAMMIQDTRGRFASDGDWTGRRSEGEGLDAYDTVEWVASQPWCDGNVALYGVSYPGNVSWRGALEQPPHLRAIAPALTSDPEASKRHSGGAMVLELAISWVVRQLALDTIPKLFKEGKVDQKAVDFIDEALAHPSLATDFLPLKKNPYLMVEGSPMDPQTSFPGHVPPRSFAYEDVQVPAFLVGGWFDIGTPFALLKGMRDRGGGGEDAREANRLVVGPWVHGVQLPEVQGDLDFGPRSLGRLELFPLYLAFFDRHLKGRTDNTSPRIRYFHMGPNKWRDADEWPLPEATPRRWHLDSLGHANTAGGDGFLGIDPPGGAERFDEYRYDPANPVRTYGGKILYNAAGPLNQQHVEERPDVLCYTSDAFTKAFDLMGPVALRLFASSSARDTDFMAKLTDVFPDGRSILLLEGSLRARYRRGFDEEVFLEPGSIEEYLLDLGHTAWRVEPGHRLRIQVESSNFPWLDRNMNTGNAVGDDDAGIVADQRIFHGGQYDSYLEAFCV
jgi:uncharacterized protein